MLSGLEDENNSVGLTKKVDALEVLGLGFTDLLPYLVVPDALFHVHIHSYTKGERILKM